MATDKQFKISSEFEKLPLKKMMTISFLISAITIFIGLISQIFLPPVIPLYYGLPQTEAQIVPSIMIVVPSFLALLVTTINMFLAIKNGDNYLKKVLAFSTISFSILASITTYKIIFLIGSI